MGYTEFAKAENQSEKWYVIDAEGKILGRLASDIAYVLRGKHSPAYTPHVNMNTHVIVLNADKVRLTGRKWTNKSYAYHTGWPGGIHEATAEQVNQRTPGDLVRRAVWGMLPKGRLGHATMKRLRIYTGSDHSHQAQKPEPLPVRSAQA